MFAPLLSLICFIASLFWVHPSVNASSLFDQEGICVENADDASICDETTTDSQFFLPSSSSNRENILQPRPTGGEDHKTMHPKDKTIAPVNQTENIIIYLFWGDGCPHCKKEKQFFAAMEKRYPSIILKDFEVWYDQHNADFLTKMAHSYGVKASGVPIAFIDRKVFIGFSENTRKEITELLEKCSTSGCIDPLLILSGKVSPYSQEMPGGAGMMHGELQCTEKNKTVYIPWLGSLDASEMSLPVITIVIAGLDSFNPCAFFILLTLLGLLIHAKSRGRMLIIGSVFVFFSGFIYFIFMAAWLNLFLFMGQVQIITLIAGTVAVLIAGLNIKDFFAFKKGASLSIPDSAKPKLYDRMRKLLKSTSTISLLIGTVILAAAANSYELLCTFGFPMVFTRILTLNSLSNIVYYLYLVLYNMVYVIPLMLIVLLFTITLGKKNLTEWQGRVLKLVSGTMMLGLGGVLILDPSILSNALISFILLLGALIVSLVTAVVVKRLRSPIE
jgi:thiol-disulfide isomerase/thioredoxin